MELTEDRRALLIDLHVRIEAARLEIETLRRSRSLNPREELNPEWREFSPWAPKAH
jgi:hypothetical protein